MADGIASVEPRVSAGLSAQPLVTDATPVVTPDAVQKLTDAVRSGFITSQDILDRVGPLGQGERKAKIEQLKEYVNPDVIESRMAQARQAGAQAQLGTAQAQAAQPLVAPQADLAQQQLLQQRETMNTKKFVDAFSRYQLPIYKVDPKTGQQTSQYDYDAMAREGQQYFHSEMLFNQASQALAADPREVYNPKTKQKEMWMVSKLTGEDVSPGSEAWKFWMKKRNESFEFLHSNVPDTTPTNQPAVQPRSPSAPTGPAAATQGLPDVTAAAPVSGPGSGNSMADVVHAAVSAAQGNPAPQPTVQSATAPIISHVATGPPAPGNFQTPKEWVDHVYTSDAYKNMAEKQPIANSFKSLVDSYKTDPDQISAVKDAELANYVLALSTSGRSPGGRGGGEALKVNRIEEAVPILEKIGALPQTLLKKHLLPEQQRERVIQAGFNAIHGMEQSAGQMVDVASKGLQGLGEDPAKYFTNADLAMRPGATLMDKYSELSQPPRTAPSRGAVKITKPITGLGTGSYDFSTGLFHPEGSAQ